MYSIEKIRPLLLNPHIDDGKIIKGILQIQESFTQKLETRDIYVEERDLVSSYTAFYLPTNAVKLSWGMSLLSPDLKALLRGSRLIDFGCGPGTYSLAWLDYFGGSDVHCVDQSELMLAQAKKVLSGFHPKGEYSFSSRLPEKKENTTLLFGNSLNEMTIVEAENTISSLDPEFIVFIEPGTKVVFDQLIKLRSQLLTKGYHIHYPCLNNNSCPITDDDWCHQVIRTTHHESIERLSQKAKIDRRTMPLCFHVYARKVSTNNTQGRIVRFLRESKFSFDYIICMGDQLVEIQIMKKNHSKKQVKQIKEINVGESIEFNILKKLKEDFFRVSLI